MGKDRSRKEREREGRRRRGKRQERAEGRVSSKPGLQKEQGERTEEASGRWAGSCSGGSMTLALNKRSLEKNEDKENDRRL